MRLVAAGAGVREASSRTERKKGDDRKGLVRRWRRNARGTRCRGAETQGRSGQRVRQSLSLYDGEGISNMEESGFDQRSSSTAQQQLSPSSVGESAA